MTKSRNPPPHHLGMDQTLQINGLKHFPQLVQGFHWNFGWFVEGPEPHITVTLFIAGIHVNKPCFRFGDRITPFCRIGPLGDPARIVDVLVCELSLLWCGPPNPCLSYQNPPFPRRCWEVPKFKTHPFCDSCLLLCSGRLFEMVDLWVSSDGAGPWLGLGIWRVKLWGGMHLHDSCGSSFSIRQGDGELVGGKRKGGRLVDHIHITMYTYIYICISIYRIFQNDGHQNGCFECLKSWMVLRQFPKQKWKKSAIFRMWALMFLMFHSRWTHANRKWKTCHANSLPFSPLGFRWFLSPQDFTSFYFFWVWITMNRVATAPFKGRKKNSSSLCSWNTPPSLASTEAQILFETVIS